MRLILLFLTLFLLQGCVSSSWRPEDTNRLVLKTSLAGIDYFQTKKAVVDNCGSWYESNPVIGKHPSAQRLRNHIAVSSVIQYYVSKELPTNYGGIDYRKTFQIFMIAMEIWTISDNERRWRHR